MKMSSLFRVVLLLLLGSLFVNLKSYDMFITCKFYIFLGGRWQFSFFFLKIIIRGSRLFSFLEWSDSPGVFSFQFPFCTSCETDFSVSILM